MALYKCCYYYYYYYYYGRLLVKLIFASDKGELHFNALARGVPLWIFGETCCCVSRNQNDFPTWCWKPHDRIFILLDKTPECDGRTDGQNRSDYYSGLHCAQCGRAVNVCKRVHQLHITPRFITSYLHTAVITVSSVLTLSLSPFSALTLLAAVIWPVKIRPRYDLPCAWWDVQPYSTNYHSFIPGLRLGCLRNPLHPSQPHGFYEHFGPISAHRFCFFCFLVKAFLYQVLD